MMSEEEVAAAAGRSKRSIFPPSPKATAPWLVVPYGKPGTHSRKQAFYNICEPKDGHTCTKCIPELIAKTCFQKPSHRGWLIHLCDGEKYDYSPDNYKFGDCFLWNPATLETIRLPSLSKWYGGRSTGFYLVDCVLSPLAGGGGDINESLVLFVFSDAREGTCNLVFLYCHPGCREWMRYRWKSETVSVSDMMSLHSFRSEFYLMCFGMQHLRITYLWELDGSIYLVARTIEVRGLAGSYPLVGGLKTTSVAFYFVETGDQLYCISVTYTLRGFRKVVIQMTVMRLELSRKEMAWRVVHNIGDCVLFISCERTTSACCSAADTGLDRGCLYFTLPDDQCLYKFDIQSSGILVVGPRLKVPEGWKGSEFIMVPNQGQGRRRKEPMVDEKKALQHQDLPHEWLLTAGASLMLNKDHNCNTFTFISINSMHNDKPCPLVLPRLEGAVIRYQKGGWLLVSVEEDEFGLCFYNPLAGEAIELPPLPVPYTFSSISFSSLPTSPDCAVFAIEQGMHCNIHIYFIIKGETTWSSGVFTSTNTDKYMPSYNTPVFYNGKLYSVDYNGSLAVSSIEGDSISWEVLEKPGKQFEAIYPGFLVECGGELLLVKTGRLGMLVGIFKLDFSRMLWVKIENLGKHILLVSHTSCFSLVAPDRHMENKVYFPRLCQNGEGLLFYCLDTGSYRSFGSHSASDFTGTEGWCLNCTWVEPNWSKSTAQELEWVECPSSIPDSTWIEANGSKSTPQ